LTSVFFAGNDSITIPNLFPDCPLLDTVCVSPDFHSDNFGEHQVSTESETCLAFQDLFNHCYKGVFVDGGFATSKRVNTTQWESESDGCVFHFCDNETGRETHLSCPDKECYISQCNKSTGSCDYIPFYPYDLLMEEENHCYEVVCYQNEWILQKRTNATQWENLTNACYEFMCMNLTGPESWQRENASEWENRSTKCYEYKCNNLTGPVEVDNCHLDVWLSITVPIFVIAAALIVVLASPLRGKVFPCLHFGSGGDEENKVLSVAIDGQVRELHLGKKLGKGSFGTVWLAEAGELTVAAKEMEKEFEQNEQEYKKELEIMSQLHSEYVVRVFGSVVTKTSYFIIMEYMPLKSLTTALRKCTFSPYMRCRFMLDVARGMQYLHEQGIIHRDLKPGNVLVATLDPFADVLCKITDFGEARKAMNDTHTMTMTSGIGSPFYMAPEMIRNDSKYTRAVDTYSFGIMCVELWNEMEPYSEMHFESTVSFALYVLDGNRPNINDDCPRRLVALISECWDADRLVRPSFSSLVNDLVPIVKKVRRSLPKGIEHVKLRDHKKAVGSPETKAHEEPEVVDEKAKSVPSKAHRHQRSGSKSPSNLKSRSTDPSADPSSPKITKSKSAGDESYVDSQMVSKSKSKSTGPNAESSMMRKSKSGDHGSNHVGRIRSKTEVEETKRKSSGHHHRERIDSVEESNSRSHSHHHKAEESKRKTTGDAPKSSKEEHSKSKSTDHGSKPHDSPERKTESKHDKKRRTHKSSGGGPRSPDGDVMLDEMV